MTSGNSLALMYHNGTKYTTFGFATANSMQISNETQTVSSKDHGRHPEISATNSNCILLWLYAIQQ